MNDLMVNSYGLPECLDAVEQASGWHERVGRLPPGKGLGMACSHYVSGAAKPIHWTGEPHAAVNLKLDFDGSITAFTGAADIGQGSSTMVAIAVAETLDVALERVRVVAGDSAITPKDNGAYSSRITFMVGNAAIDAAKNLKKILIEAAARKLEASPEDIECAGEQFRVGGGGQAVLPFADVVQAALVDVGAVTVKGTFTCPPEAQGGRHRGGAVGSTMGFSYAAQVVEVSVDEATGAVTVDKVWTALDCGRAINPLAVEGQIQGSVWMGMGQALSEETQYLDGLPAHASLLEYRIPTIVESPPIEVHIVESHDPYGPFGAKEASEGALPGFPRPSSTRRECHRRRPRRNAGHARSGTAAIRRAAKDRLRAAWRRAASSPRRLTRCADFCLRFSPGSWRSGGRFARRPASAAFSPAAPTSSSACVAARHSGVLIDLVCIDDCASCRHGRRRALGAGVTLPRLPHDGDARAIRGDGGGRASIAGPGHRSVATVAAISASIRAASIYNQSEWWRPRTAIA